MQISIFLWSCVLEKWSCISLRMTTIDMLPIYVDDHSRIILHYIYRFKDHHTGCFLCINKRTYDTDVADLRFIDKKIQTETSNKQKKNSTLGTVQSGAKPFTQMSPKIFSHDAEHHVKWKHRISVKHDSLVVLGLFCSQVLIEPTANSSEYQNILESNVRPPVCQLKICLNWVMQQDDDYKAQQQIWNRTAEEEKNHGVAMAQSLIVGAP